MRRSVSVKTFLSSLALLSIILVGTFSWIQANAYNGPMPRLDVEISPRDVKLFVGEVQTFHVLIRNGSSPFDCKWYSDGNYTGYGETIEFSFAEPCNYTVLSVVVTDSFGCVGTDSVFVYDPAEIIIEPDSFHTEVSYIMYQEDSTTYMRNGDTGEIDWSSSDPTAVFSACIGNTTAGGSLKIVLRAGSDYTFSDTVDITTLRGLVLEGEGAGMTGEVTRIIAPSGKPAFTLNGSAYGQALHVVMSQIEIQGDSSSGQIGIELDTVHISTFRNMEFWNLDEAIRLHEASHYNTFDTMKIYNVNTGVYDRYNNYMNTYRNLWMSLVADYGYYQPSTGGSSHPLFENFGVDGAATAHGIYIGAGAVNVQIKHGYFVDVGKDNDKTAIYLKGLSGTYPIRHSSIEDTYFNRCGYGVRTDYVDGLTVQNCRSLLTNQTGAEFSSNTKRLKKISNYFDSETDNSIEQVMSLQASWTVFDDGTYTSMQDSTGTVIWRSTDSDAVFTACVGNLTSGGMIFFRQAEYIIDTVIPLGSNIILDSDGAVFKMDDNAGLWGGIFRIGYDIENVTVRNLRFEGNRANNPGECTLLYIRRANNTLIENCVFNDARVGIHFYSSDVEDRSNNLVIDKCRLTNSETAIAITPNSTGLMESITISNNYIDTTTIYGVNLQYPSGVQFVDNYLTNMERGLFLWDCDNFVVSNNELVDASDIQYYGAIQSQSGCSNGLITNNLIEYTVNPTTDSNGIVVQADQENIVVSNNVVIGGDFANVKSGIYLHGTDESNLDVVRVSVVGNVIEGYANGIVVTYSEDCVVSSNVVNVTVCGLYPATANRITWTNNRVISATGVYGSATDNTFIGNDLTSCTTSVNLLSGSGNIFQHNKGYLHAYNYIIYKDDTYTCVQDSSGVVTRGTDSRTIINPFIASVTSGARILVKSGTYTISGLYILVAVNDLVIEGEGDSTVFVADDALDNQVMYLSGANNITLRDFKIDGNSGGQTAWGNGMLLSATNVLIERVTIEDCYEHGVTISSASDQIEVSSCRFEDNRMRGINVASSTNIWIHDNFVNNNGLGGPGYAGIHIGGESQVVDISHNTVTNQQGNSANVSGIKVFSVPAINYLPLTTISNNICNDNDGQGIWIVDSHNVLISNNLCYNNSYSGIYVEKSNGAIVDGNECLTNGNEGLVIGSYGGVFSDFAIVTANKLSNNTYCGLYGDSDNAVISGNMFKNNGQGGTQYNQWNGIWWQGGNCTIDGNMFVDDQGTITMKYGINLNSSVADDCTIFSNVMRGLSVALNLESTSDDTWVALNDFRYNTDDVEDQGTNTTWTDNWSISSFHENTAPDD